jgi:hypothetical protein
MSRSSSVLLSFAARVVALLSAASLAFPASAQAPRPSAGGSGAPSGSVPATGSAPAGGRAEAVAPGDAHRRDDIARHRAIAAAHDAAARCLESGSTESECQQALRRACEGIAVGRYCGMKHSH